MTLRDGAVLTAILGLLAGCDGAPSAVESRERTAALTAAPAASTANAPAPALAGVRPAMTANRRETADAKIQRLYERNGAAFGARSAEDYLSKVEAFVVDPPADVERVSRPNGDVLLYQAATNTFAVVDADGVPRTMFKPDDGPAYWAEQKAAAPTFGQNRPG